MDLGELRVVHALKSGANYSIKLEGLGELAGVFHINTCQRLIWIYNKKSVDSRVPSLFKKFKGLDHYRGVEAYRFLLLIATGLESEIPGETDIFGQIKTAWKKWTGMNAREISVWIQRLFEDTKEIRSTHLQNLGGASYGSLLRMFLKEKMEKAPGPILILGAGQLAKTVFPYFSDSDVLIWNRTPENLRSIVAQRSDSTAGRIRILKDELEGWRQAAHVIVCIPPDPVRDSKRIKVWSQENIHVGRTVSHLGILCESSGNQGEWSHVTGFHSLDDLFQLQRSQFDFRASKIASARKACFERAKLRELGNSISIPHGWEDLAVFVS